MALKVGFVGLGTMGVGMARNLARAGFPLALSTRTLSKAQALAGELGAKAFGAPEEVARVSDVVVSCLPDSPEVEEVHLGPAQPVAQHGVVGNLLQVTGQGGVGELAQALKFLAGQPPCAR